jgi:NADPH-dependent curcumin reductase
MKYACWRVAKLSEGMIQPSDFRWEEGELPPLGPGQVQVETLYISLDPTNRVWLQGRDTYMPGLKVGEIMRGLVIGRVTESRHPDLQPGTYVYGVLGWQTAAVADGSALTPLPPPDVIPLTAEFGLLGHIGLTAHYGMLAIGKPKPGEVVVVSTAAGAVGSLAVQIAKLSGCRVVGIAGSAEKCAWVVDELGADACIDYKTEALDQALARACPQGIDLYFDNVGGATLDAVIGRMKDFGRIVACGMISDYNVETRGFMVRNLLDVVTKRLMIKGFVCLDHLDQAPAAYQDLMKWYQEGKLRYRVDEVEGLRSAPSALGRLFDGSNRGKLVVKVAG